MKRHHSILNVLGILSLIVICPVIFVLPAAAGSVPSVIIDPSHVISLDKKTKVTIMGSGFEPGQKIRLVIFQPDGSMTDIGDGLNPEPLVNNDGVWATVWELGGYSDIAQPGLNRLQVCDTEYNVLATIPFGYYDAKKPYKEWPSWAQAVVKEPKAPEKK